MLFRSRRFRPEFLNRLDETIVFRQLARAEVKEIAGILLSTVAARVGRKGIELQVTEGFKERVVEEGFDTSYGVKPLKRAIVRLLEDTRGQDARRGDQGRGFGDRRRRSGRKCRVQTSLSLSRVEIRRLRGNDVPVWRNTIYAECKPLQFIVDRHDRYVGI